MSDVGRPTIHFNNTLTRHKDAFEPLAPPSVGFYSCGPTVYSDVHIGNLRCFVGYDLIRRYLEWRGYEVHHVMNVTDVDDKTIRVAREEGVSLGDVTRRYEEAFLSALRKLNCHAGWALMANEGHPATTLTRATEHIDDMLALVNDLIAKGIAYHSDDGSIYYSVSRFPGYGKLSRLDQREIKSGARVSHDEYAKEEARDFALWKAWCEDDGDVAWDAGDLGRGRPGWHIECSAMSMRYLGHTLDIHAGGEDLIFPHHENEIAQSEPVTGQPFARYFLHNAHLMVDGGKMEKRAGTCYRLADLEDRNLRSLAVRYALMAAHYRAPLNFTWDGMATASGALTRLDNLVRNLGRQEAGQEATGTELTAARNEAASTRRRFDSALADDLNVPEALGAVFDFVSWANRREPTGKAATVGLELLADLDAVLGLGLAEQVSALRGGEVRDAEADRIDALLVERTDARSRKDFSRSDAIRDQLASEGVIIEDTPDGPQWHRKAT